MALASIRKFEHLPKRRSSDSRNNPGRTGIVENIELNSQWSLWKTPKFTRSLLVMVIRSLTAANIVLHMLGAGI